MTTNRPSSAHERSEDPTSASFPLPTSRSRWLIGLALLLLIALARPTAAQQPAVQTQSNSVQTGSTPVSSAQAGSTRAGSTYSGSRQTDADRAAINSAVDSGRSTDESNAPTATMNQKVVAIDIATEVDPGMVSYVDRAVDEAEAEHAAVLLLNINTFGGRLDAGTKIRDKILEASKKLLTVAYIDRRAISAGALIALATDKIVMAPGSTIGAATPIYENGEKASEKVVSYMRAEMRATVEHNHRDPRIAEAMVDESIGLDSSYGIRLPPGKLLTLTSADALRLHYAEAEAPTMEAALKAVGIEHPEIEHTDESFGDKSIRFLTSGIVSSILIMIGIAGIFFSLKTGHFGPITFGAVVALVLFFGGQYITSIAPVLALILFLAGVTMLLIEVATPVPTFGIAGILGLGGIFLGLFLALAGDLRTLTPDRLSASLQTLAVALVGIIVLGYLIVKYAPRATWLRKFRNEATTADTSFYEARESLLGMHGIAQTMLRPAGLVLVAGKTIDAVTNGEFLDPGTHVVVTQVRGNRPIVHAVDEAAVIQRDERTPDTGDSYGGRLPRQTHS